MKILYKVTSRSRPERLKETLLSIVNNTSKVDHLICLSMDEDDKTVNNPDFIKWYESNIGWELHPIFGKSKNKIDAINRDIDKFKVWDILVNVSDDQVFIAKSFDLEIQLMFKMVAPDLDAFLHFRDSNHDTIDALSTMSIVGRKYYERDNYIYHPSYQSVWCDNEAMEVAKIRGKYHFFNSLIFDHLHPAYGKAQNDAQYRKTESSQIHRMDHLNFKKRQKINFGL